MLTSIQEAQGLLVKIQTAYFKAKTQRDELIQEISLLRITKDELLLKNKDLSSQLNGMAEEGLQKVSLSQDYENLLLQHKKQILEYQALQQDQREKEITYKRSIYMLESEGQLLRLQVERQKGIIEKMQSEIENILGRFSRSGYGELVEYNQQLQEKIEEQQEQLIDQRSQLEKQQQRHSEELSRQIFNYEILVQQYQTLQKENNNGFHHQHKGAHFDKQGSTFPQRLSATPDIKVEAKDTTAKKKRIP